MEQKITEDGEVVFIELSGDIIGGPDAGVLNTKIRELVDSGKPKIAIDLSQVDLMNSTGLGILIGALTTVKKSNGDLVLVNVTARIKNLLVITKLDSVFRIFNSMNESKQYFEGLS